MHKRATSSGIWPLGLVLGCVVLGLWLWPKLAHLGYPARMPQQVDIGPLVELDLPDDARFVTDILDMSIFDEGWSGGSSEEHYLDLGGACVSSHSILDYGEDLWSIFDLGSQPFTRISLRICIWSDEEFAIESMGDYCRSSGPYVDRSDFVYGREGSWEYCISYVYIERDLWFRRHYDSMIVLRSGRVMVYIEESMMKAHWRTQEVINLLAEKIIKDN